MNVLICCPRPSDLPQKMPAAHMALPKHYGPLNLKEGAAGRFSARVRVSKFSNKSGTGAKALPVQDTAAVALTNLESQFVFFWG